MKFGRDECVKLLILRGAPVVAKRTANDGQQYNTVHMACLYGHPKCLEIVLDLGNVNVDILNEEDDTLTTGLMIACKRGHLKCVELLLDRDANASPPANW